MIFKYNRYISEFLGLHVLLFLKKYIYLSFQKCNTFINKLELAVISNKFMIDSVMTHQSRYLC